MTTPQIQAIKQFGEKVQWLNEFEYGDFKRKLGLYINQLGTQLGPDPQSQGIVDELRDRVVYRPDGDMEATRAWVLGRVRKWG